MPEENGAQESFFLLSVLYLVSFADLSHPFYYPRSGTKNCITILVLKIVQTTLNNQELGGVIPKNFLK